MKHKVAYFLLYYIAGGEKMRIIDMHCDTVLECYLRHEGLRKNSLCIDLESMNKNNALLQFFAIFLGRDENDADRIKITDPYRLFLEVCDFYKSEIRDNSDLISEVKSYDDIAGNSKRGRMSSLLTVEDGRLIDGDIGRLNALYEKGVRLITLTWNDENCIGFPNSPCPGEHLRGLKPFGIEVVREMNRLGMIIDVSHLSEGGFFDVAKHTEKPFVASHSCARALCDHPRNLTDDQLRRVAESGGVVGVNFNAGFLRKNASVALVSDIIEHIRYMIRIMGEDHVALGSDFDGIECPTEISGYENYGSLADRIREEFKESTAEKICCKNVLRVMKDCLRKEEEK